MHGDACASLASDIGVATEVRVYEYDQGSYVGLGNHLRLIRRLVENAAGASLVTRISFEVPMAADPIAHNDSVPAPQGMIYGMETPGDTLLAKIGDVVWPVCQLVAGNTDDLSAEAVQKEWLVGVELSLIPYLNAVLLVLLPNLASMWVTYPLELSGPLRAIFDVARVEESYRGRTASWSHPDVLRRSVLDRLEHVGFVNDLGWSLQWRSLEQIAALLSPSAVRTAHVELPIFRYATDLVPQFFLSGLDTLTINVHRGSTNPSRSLGPLVRNAKSLRKLSIDNLDRSTGRNVLEWDWAAVNSIIRDACLSLTSLSIAALHSSPLVVPLLPFYSPCRLERLDMYAALLLPCVSGMQSSTSVVSSLVELPASLEYLVIRCGLPCVGDDLDHAIQEHHTAYNAVCGLLSQNSLPSFRPSLRAVRMVVHERLVGFPALVRHRQTVESLCRDRAITLSFESFVEIAV